MLNGEIRSKIDALWNAFWTGGISNPLEVIEQITYLLFLKRLDELKRMSKGTGTKYLTMELLNRIRVPVPPIASQREFARRVTAVEKLKTAQRASLAELDALFATLQHRAFRGEL